MNEVGKNGSRDTMAARIPEITRVLRSGGIARVIATYAETLCALAFVNAQGSVIPPPCSHAMTADLAQMFATLAKQRTVLAANVTGISGWFRWDLSRDNVTHEHTVKFDGL